MKPLEFIKAPALDSDAQTFRDDNRSIHWRLALERKVVANLIHNLTLNGFTHGQVQEGEGNGPKRSLSRPDAIKRLMQDIDGYDECAVVFWHPERETGFWASLVFGNDGDDCIADYGCPEGFAWTEVLEALTSSDINWNLV